MWRHVPVLEAAMGKISVNNKIVTEMMEIMNFSYENGPRVDFMVIDEEGRAEINSTMYTLCRGSQ